MPGEQYKHHWCAVILITTFLAASLDKPFGLFGSSGGATREEVRPTRIHFIVVFFLQVVPFVLLAFICVSGKGSAACFSRKMPESDSVFPHE